MNSPNETLLIFLLDRTANRDKAAFEQLYRLCAPKLYGLALRITNDPSKAEDATQEAFIQIWQQATHYKQSLSPPLAWMGMLVRSRCLDLLRRSHLHYEEPISDSITEPLLQTDPDDNSAEDSYIISQQAQALHRCLARLGGHQRQVIMLAYLRELSHSELAQQLKLPLGTVKSWIRRGLEQLRTCLGSYV